MELSKSSRESESAAAESANVEEQPLLSRDQYARESSSSSHARQGQTLPYFLTKMDLGIDACLCRASQGWLPHLHIMPPYSGTFQGEFMCQCAACGKQW